MIRIPITTKHIYRLMYGGIALELVASFTDILIHQSILFPLWCVGFLTWLFSAIVYFTRTGPNGTDTKRERAERDAKREADSALRLKWYGALRNSETSLDFESWKLLQ